ncbi:MAG: roadblock/LC7 domain-containing protein [Gammaproteobacteria bacterium]|nr:roadblock/LC7 domain-containing protein [Gammaproteobacteria bacterium]
MDNDKPTANLLIEPLSTLSTGGTEELNSILEDLHSACVGVQLSMIATTDGLTMASLGTVLDPDQVGAMCSELQTVCNKTATELQQGTLQQMLLKCSDGYMLVTTAGEQAVLAMMTKPNVNLGFVIIESQRAADAIRQSLG